MILIGDVHGKFKRYKKIIKEHRNTIQVGDLGLGFRNIFGNLTQNPPYDIMVASGARFIRGNHDNPGFCREHTQFIHDGTKTILDGRTVFFVGGAFSIDRAFRTEGYDWWPDEEVSYEEGMKLLETYDLFQPQVMITHDCPDSISRGLSSHHGGFSSSRTRELFDQMFATHRPDIWVFGHHHLSYDQEVLGTRFICLAELEVREI